MPQMVPLQLVSKNILNINEEEFRRMQSEMFSDRKHDFALEQVGEVAAAEAGGMGGDLGAEMGGEDLGAVPDIPEMPEEAGEEPEGEEGPLLATPGTEEPAPEGGAGEESPPGKRDEKDRYGRPLSTTTKSKSKWYKPKASDRRTGKKQSFLAMGGNQYTGTSSRSFLPGASEINSLFKNLSEDLNANYHDEQEKEIFQENIEIKKLINSLQQAESSTDET